MKISEQIRFRREQLGLSIMDVAKQIGVSDQTVRYWESARSRPDKERSPRLEKALSRKDEKPWAIDWHEGQSHAYTAELLSGETVELARLLSALPPRVGRMFAELAKEYQAIGSATSTREHLAEEEAGVVTIKSTSKKPHLEAKHVRSSTSPSAPTSKHGGRSHA